ncbi:MAG: hypothetical protein ABID45_03920 [Patescibacteria group bacterium]
MQKNLQNNSKRKQRVIAIWCAPRSASTALFRAFEQLENTRCLFEPFAKNFYFSKERISYRYLPKNEIDPKYYYYTYNKIRDILFKRSDKELTLFKECVFQASNYLESRIIRKIDYNIILIRDPRLTLFSLLKFKPDFTEIEAGYTKLNQLYFLLKKNNNKLIIIDANDLRNNPKVVIKLLCKEINIVYTDNMLNWNRESEIGFNDQADFYKVDHAIVMCYFLVVDDNA